MSAVVLCVSGLCLRIDNLLSHERATVFKVGDNIGFNICNLQVGFVCISTGTICCNFILRTSYFYDSIYIHQSR